MNKAPLSGERKKSQSSTTKSRSSSVPRGRHNAISLRNSNGKHDSKKSSSEDEEESSSESESEMSESDETVDIKVSIAHAHEVRGFSVHVRRGFTKIMRQLEECYGSRPKLSYYDDDGDRVSILASTDFEYAVRIHKNMTSIQKKSKKMGANKLTLIAEFIQHISLSDIRIRSTSRSLDSLLQKSLDASLDLDACRDTIHTVSGSTKEKTEDREKGRTELCEVLWQRGELLGSGSFGQVFSGIDMSTGLRIAVKEVNLGRGARHEQQAFALLREIKILSTLDHPNIIKYLGTEYSHHTMRIFLELATEGSIKDALTAFGALAEPIIRKYALDIISGLAFLHSKRVIHRDIKPTNLLISNGVIKLADFGCSSSSFDPVADHATSEMGHATVTGTTVYMAPEVMGMEDLSQDNTTDNSITKKDNHSYQDGRKSQGRKCDWAESNEINYNNLKNIKYEKEKDSADDVISSEDDSCHQRTQRLQKLNKEGTIYSKNDKNDDLNIFNGSYDNDRNINNDTNNNNNGNNSNNNDNYNISDEINISHINNNIDNDKNHYLARMRDGNREIDPKFHLNVSPGFAFASSPYNLSNLDKPVHHRNSRQEENNTEYNSRNDKNYSLSKRNQYNNEYDKSMKNKNGNRCLKEMKGKNERNEEVENKIENDNAGSSMKANTPMREKKNGYGRKADIWSFGVTLAEMSVGKPYYRSAGAAIYNICVTKQYPSFSDVMSADAHNFLARCLVAEPRSRASCEELLSHPFLTPLGKIHTISTVSFSPIESLPIESEIDFIKGKDKDKDKEREKDRIKTPNFSSSCTSTDSNSETGSRYSSVGVCDSWLKSEKENKEGKSRDEGRVFNGGEGYKERGRREGGKEYRDASKWEKSACPQLNFDIFAHFNSPHPCDPPPRNNHK